MHPYFVVFDLAISLFFVVWEDLFSYILQGFLIGSGYNKVLVK